MLLGNSHIKESLWEALLEGSEPSRTGHGSGNGHDVIALFGSG